MFILRAYKYATLKKDILPLMMSFFIFSGMNTKKGD